MAHEVAPADVTAVSDHPGQPRDASSHGITLDWQKPALTRPSPLAVLQATGAPSLVIGFACLTLALVAAGALMWSSASSNSAQVGSFSDDMPEFTVRATPRDTAPRAPIPAPEAAAPEAAASGIVGPDVAPAWTVIQVAIPPNTGAAARQAELDILAATAAMPTGSISPATDAGTETNEEANDLPAPPANRGAMALRRATGLDSANKARQRTRNTKWTGTFFDQ